MKRVGTSSWFQPASSYAHLCLGQSWCQKSPGTSPQNKPQSPIGREVGGQNLEFATAKRTKKRSEDVGWCAVRHIALVTTVIQLTFLGHSQGSWAATYNERRGRAANVDCLDVPLRAPHKRH